MQDLSYDPQDPILKLGPYRLTVQVFTFENVYGLDPATLDVRRDATRLDVRAPRLTWAGGQETADGDVSVVAQVNEGRVRVDVTARLPHTIRCVKVTFKDVARGDLVHLREGRRAVPPEGTLLRYPEGWRGLYAPLVVLETPEGNVWAARSLDSEVREKRFALLPRGERLDVELIFEDLATRLSREVRVPTWEAGPIPSVEAALTEHAELVRAAHDLQLWQTRPDVPAWAREIDLVAAIHGQHYSGFIFNDYAKMLRILAWLSERMDGRLILAYLPGWEGRYYWQYGEYRPDERMGGVDGFARLVDGARALGVRVMPMFGMNVVNKGLPNYEQWGEPSVHATPGGSIGAHSVDWDGSRHFNHGHLTLLNPGAPTWQNRLVEQITGLHDRYGFDAAFLDISAAWVNDPRFDTFTGVRTLVARLREGRPDLLVAGEGWYDALGAVTPFVQAGHTDGVPHYHDDPCRALFTPFARCFGHLCLGDLGRGSTGVHELGFNEANLTPNREGVIPTLTFVEDTLERSADVLDKVLHQVERRKD